jgi:CBS domain-containing protein
MKNTCLRNVVTPLHAEVVAVDAAASLLRGIELMTRHTVNELVVRCDDGIFRVVTACSVLATLSEGRDPLAVTLGDIAVPLEFCADAESTLEDTLVRMRTTQSGQVHVSDAAVYLGLLSLTQLLEYALYDVQCEVSELHAYISGPGVLPTRAARVLPMPPKASNDNAARFARR